MKKIDKLLVEWYGHPKSTPINQPPGELIRSSDDHYHGTWEHSQEEAANQLHNRLSDHYSESDTHPTLRNTYDRHPFKLKGAEDLHQFAIHSYTRDSKEVNSSLISHNEGSSSPTQELPESDFNHSKSKSISEFLSKAPKAPEDFHVYTGVGRNLNILRHRSEGATHMRLHAFTSATINPETTGDFGGFKRHVAYKQNGEFKPYKETIRIKIPKDSQHGAYIGKASHHPDEKEFLLNKGLKLRFVGEPTHIIGNDVHHVLHDAEIVHE